MRIAVLGAPGQLGRDLVPRLSGEVLAWGRNDLDLEKPETIRPALETTQPQIIINCAAYNLVDKAEADPDAAFKVNAWGLRELAKACQSLKIKLVHVSTDYVFGLDTQRDHPWTETDAPGPVSVYGLSKLSGEYVVRSTVEDHLVIRTCGLYGVWGSGGKGGNFVETMLRVAGQGKPLRVVNDQHCTPTYTADLAMKINELIGVNAKGLFQVTNSEATTWHDLAAQIFQLSGISANLTPITSEEFNAPARRPKYSVLSNEKLRTVGLKPLRPWDEALRDYLTERLKKPTA
jgi:dTDP-4-dehydrorhamnose reductase